VLAIIASAVGSMRSGPAGRKLMLAAQRVQQTQASGGAPDPADVAEIQTLQARIGGTQKLVATLLVLSAATMAVARYV
jgi:hypothetical protein